MPLSPAEQAEYDLLTQFVDADRERAACEGSLFEFFKRAWREIDPAPFEENWHHHAICAELESLARGEVRDIVINIPPRTGKSILTSVAFPAWLWTQTPDKAYPLVGPHCSFLCVSYGAVLAEVVAVKMRRLVMGEWYQRLWGSRVQIRDDQASRSDFGNTAGGERISNSIEGGILGRGALIQICDDPHKLDAIESDVERSRTLRAIKEGLTTRVTDPRISARILVMQRLHTDDCTEYALNNWRPDLRHIMVPMRFDPGRRSFCDPRTEVGELLWPEVWTEEAVRREEAELGAYACTPPDSPVLMADLSIKPIGDLVPGDQVVGFTAEHAHIADRGLGRRHRRKLMSATVKQVFRYHNAPLVRLRLKSGRSIVCTPDHKWWQKAKDPSRPLYRPAKVGRKLGLVCDVDLPELTGDDLRLAGWLGGFFDGEGSVSLMHKFGGTRGYRPSSNISFYQGAGRNLPLCNKLEYALGKFGFKWRMYEDERKDNKTAACYGYRAYTLVGAGLPLYQRFLHIAKPEKWVDRITTGAYGAKFIREWDEILAIEPSGWGDVCALETSTGNYIVHGYASSNSAGQLQQMPTPRGGGIIKSEWVEPWPPLNTDGTFPEDMIDARGRIRYPAFEYVVACVDTAFTKKQTADRSAMAVIGVFRAEGKGRIERRPDGGFTRVADDYGFPKAMLIHGWAKQLDLHGPNEEMPSDITAKEWNSPAVKARRRETWGLVEWVADTCTNYKVDYLNILTLGQGHGLEQELRRLHHDNEWMVGMEVERGDKLARAYRMQHLFSARQVFAPQYEDGTYPTWCDPLIRELVTFPMGRNDDFVDAIMGALRHLREIGMMERRDEFEREEAHAMSWEANRRVPYPYQT